MLEILDTLRDNENRLVTFVLEESVEESDHEVVNVRHTDEDHAALVNVFLYEFETFIFLK